MNNKIMKVMSVTAIASILLMPINTYALSRDETVYTKISNDNSKTIVSEHITNDEESNTITDNTNLSNISNTNGDETYTLENSKLVWESNGKDIYYQGTSDKETPIKLDITYKLNGIETDPKEIVGKDGKVTITLKYTNTDKHVVNGNTLYTPFLVTVGMALPTKNNSNVKVTNGKVTSNGNTNIIAAIATPGLYQSLNIDKFKSLDTVTITYSTKSFEQGTIYSVATPKLVSNTDLNIITKLDSVYSKIDTLSESTLLLVNGSKDLLTGINTYNNKFTTYADNMNKIANYSNQFNESLKAIQKQLDDGNKQLSSSLTEYSAGIKDVATGVSEVATGASNLNTGVQGLVSIMNGMIDSYDKNAAQIETLAAQKQQLIAVGQDTSEIDAGLAQLTISNQTIATVMANFENAIMKVNTFDSTNAMEQTNITIVNKTLSTISNGSTDLVNGTNTLNTKVQTILVPSTKKLVEGISDKFTTLQNGINEFANKYASFNEGVNQLNKATTQLNDGSKTIEDGASKLYSGLTQYNNDGISALVNFVNNDVKNNAYKVQDLINLSNSYASFSDSKINGTTKYITIIEK